MQIKVQASTPEGWESWFWTLQTTRQLAIGSMCNWAGATTVDGDERECRVLGRNGKVLATYRMAVDEQGRVAPWAKGIEGVNE